ncbi:tubulin-specific chaperone c [Dothidotthia symphoricarpi CBS 119687]|uniref:Tubulin-specific chaperone c n=1 Tax=Dothidotthia symphoricarpi CBS 119687 TaxID=1392245 RepID=A0A6A6AI89_9PLEO|nr:tubulin-specific chaperone c [Dothidotthia symphoricarpi CBS 119687]KAF2130141.1 tubulin-specific chaperone c [Dothidotthia symphoricarpi CBS 119687]
MAATQPQAEAGLKECFFRDFQVGVTALQEQMERLNQTPSGDERSNAIDQCLAGIDRLSHEVKDASSYIPAYDQRTYSQTVKGLSEKLQTIRNSFNPPKKFAFKSRKSAPAKPAPNTTDSDTSVLTTNPSDQEKSILPSSPGRPLSKEKVQEEADPSRIEEADPSRIEDDGISDLAGGSGIRRPSFSSATKVTISNHKDLHIALPISASHATSSGTISNLQHCTVDFSATTKNGSPFASLYLKNIKDSLIICGRSGPAHITGIQDSIIVTACRQFRMHASKNVVVYLHCSSRPIIEDCEDIRFAPLPEIYTGYVQTMPEISKISNQWDQIDDFGWLKSEPSPHFTLLTESKWTKNEVWEDVGSDQQQLSLDDVLKIVNVRH